MIYIPENIIEERLHPDLFKPYKPKKKQGYVYIIKSCGLYKIGQTTNWSKRLSAHKTAIPAQVDVILCREHSNSPEIEKELHRTYIHVRRHGEWFSLSDNDLQEIIKYIG